LATDVRPRDGSHWKPATLMKAKGEMERKRTERRDGRLPKAGQRPRFEDFAQDYLASSALAQKKKSTQENERQALASWVAQMGGGRLDKITPPVIHGFREKRMAGGASARTVNLDAIVLRNALKLAKERGLIEHLPEVPPLKQKPSPKRTLMTREEFARLIAATTPETTRNSALFGLYLRFLALTGAREVEALAVRWADVDFERETVTIGSGGISKNHRTRAVDFSPELAALLREMAVNRPPDSSWLFSLAPAGRARRGVAEPAGIIEAGAQKGRTAQVWLP
jgi:integrase